MLFQFLKKKLPRSVTWQPPFSITREDDPIFDKKAGPVRYDFGCGDSKRHGYVGVDVNVASAADIVADLTQPIDSIPANSADYVCCLHTLEHIPAPYHIAVMVEMARILKPGGYWEIRVPYPGDDGASISGHVHVLSPRFFREFHELEEYKHQPFSHMLVDDVIVKPSEFGYWLSENLNIPLEYAVHMFRNTAQETIVIGHKIKP